MEIIIRYGKNAKENWKLFDEAESEHTLFHLLNLPSCFVIVNKSIKDITNEIVNECVNLCKSKSKYRYMKTRIFYTSIGNLMKGEKIGEIIIKNAKAIKISF